MQWIFYGAIVYVVWRSCQRKHSTG